METQKQWTVVPLDIWSRILGTLRSGRATVDGNHAFACRSLINEIADAEDKRAIVNMTAPQIADTVITECERAVHT